MPVKRFQNDRRTQDGKAYNDGTGQYKWFNSDGDQAITVGEFIIWRFCLTVPQGSTVYNATWQTEFIVKNGDTIPQSFSYNAWMEFNAAEYPMVNDTYLGPVGNFPPVPRIRTKAGVSGTLNYTANTPEADSFYINLTTCVQEIVNREDYIPGQYVSVIMTPTAENGDISLRMRDHDFASPHPNMTVDYVESFTSDVRHDIAWADNSSIELDVEDWFANAAYGYYTDAPSVMTRSSAQKRDGSYSMKVESPAAEGTKNFGVMSHYTASPRTSYVFCGWVYIPSSSGVTGVIPQFHYVTGGPEITTKDQWVPFCSNVTSVGNQPAALWPGLSGGAAVAGKHFYVDGAVVLESKHPQMPFTGYTPNDNLKTHIFVNNTTKKDASVRITRARTQAFTSDLKVFADMNDTTGWTITSGAGVTFSLENGGVKTNIPASTATVTKYTQTMGFNKRFLAVNAVWGAGLSVKSIGVNGDDPIISPRVVAISGNRKFYDLGNRATTVTYIEFQSTSQAAASSYNVYDISETEYPSNTSVLHPGTKWFMNSDGLWQRADSERQSPTFDDYGSLTLAQLAAKGLTWDQLENDVI